MLFKQAIKWATKKPSIKSFTSRERGTLSTAEIVAGTGGVALTAPWAISKAISTGGMDQPKKTPPKKKKKKKNPKSHMYPPPKKKKK